MAEAAPVSPPARPAARLAGLLYLGTIIAGLFAELGARGPLIVPADAAATAHNILAHEGLYRAGLIADLAMLGCYVGVTGLFYELFKAASRQLSLIAALFSLVGIAVLAADGFFVLAPLRLLARAPWLDLSTQAQRESLALLSLRLQGDGYDLSLVFFGVYCLLIGWLVIVSRLVPRTVGALMALAGICYLFNSLADLAAPAFARRLSPHLNDPELLGEAALSVWLILFGAKAPAVALRGRDGSGA